MCHSFSRFSKNTGLCHRIDEKNVFLLSCYSTTMKFLLNIHLVRAQGLFASCQWKNKHESVVNHLTVTVSSATRRENRQTTALIRCGDNGLSLEAPSLSLCCILEEEHMFACLYFCQQPPPQWRRPKRVLLLVWGGAGRGELFFTVRKPDMTTHFTAMRCCGFSVNMDMKNAFWEAQVCGVDQNMT